MAKQSRLKQSAASDEPVIEKEECFVIMPIGDCEGYESGHFSNVYKHLICPAIEKAGYTSHLESEDNRSNMIPLSIVEKLISMPMAICDLSSRNPNVLFELGIRQAFDMPVVLIREKGTPNIFDISSIRYFEYSRTMRIWEAQKEIENIAKALKSAKANGGVSLLKLLSASGFHTAKAKIPEIENKQEFAIKMFYDSLEEINNKIDSLSYPGKYNVRKVKEEEIKLNIVVDKLNEMIVNTLPKEIRLKVYQELSQETEDIRTKSLSHENIERAYNLEKYINKKIDSLNEQQRFEEILNAEDEQPD